MNVTRNMFTFGKQSYNKYLIGALIFLSVFVYWTILGWKLRPGGPFYDKTFIAPLEEINVSVLWRPMNFGTYQRYSPTAFVPIYLLDRHLIAPLAGISEVTDYRFSRASRLRPFFYAGFALIAVALYLIAIEFGLGVPAALFAGIYVGFHKGFSFFLQNVSTLSALLMVLYALGACFALIIFVRRGSLMALLSYYLFLILTAGSWEMWINYCIILMFSGAVMCKYMPNLSRRILPNTVIAPGVLLGAYLCMRFPYARVEFMGANEAQYYFSYPSIFLMLEELLTNLSLHITDCFDSALFPWPTLSYSVFRNVNMDLSNTYNALFTSHPSVVYRAFMIWYAGGFFMAYLIFLGYIIMRMKIYSGKINERKSVNMVVPFIAISAVTLGCSMHLPIMHRTYYLIPGFFMTYSHLFSLLGAAVLMAWIMKEFLFPLNPRHSLAMAVTASFWVAFCNAAKVYLSRGQRFPW
jgi:hypothetical protein